MMDENDGVVQLQETRGEDGEAPLLKTEAETVTSAHQRIEDVVINAGINVVDIVGSDYHTMTQSADKAEIIEGLKVIVDLDGAECSNIDGKWDTKADLHFEPVVKDFVYDCSSVTNSSDVVENNVDEDEDILSTLSGRTEEHSLQYLESPSSEEEAVYKVFGYGHGKENEAIDEEAIVAELENPQERDKVGGNMKHKEAKLDEGDGRQFLKNGAPTEKFIENGEALAEGEFRNVLVVNVPRYNVEVTPDVLATYSSKQEAILDTGCSKSVASEEWTSSYISSLSLEDQKKVVKKVSENRFRFGDNQVYISQCYIIAPVWIGGRRRTMGWDILPKTTIPLLVSLKVMKKLNMGLQLFEGDYDMATVEGVSFKIEHRQDHLWLNISPPRHQEAGDQDEDCGSVLLVIKNERADLFKMHEQWSHPPRARMISIIKKAGQWKDSMEVIIEEIYKNCHSRDCRAREQTQKVRKVGTKLPSKPGQMVAMDLKISSGKDKNILYILDLFSNFVVAEIIDSKKPEHIA